MLVMINNLLVLKSFIFLVHLLVLWEWLGLLKKSFFYKSLPLSIFFLCSLITNEESNYEIFETVVVNASIFFWLIIVPIILYRGKSFHGLLALYFAVESNFAQVGKKFPTLPFSLRAFDETIGRRRGTADREVEF